MFWIALWFMATLLKISLSSSTVNLKTLVLKYGILPQSVSFHTTFYKCSRRRPFSGILMTNTNKISDDVKASLQKTMFESSSAFVHSNRHDDDDDSNFPSPIDENYSKVSIKNSQRKIPINLLKLKQQTIEIQKVLGVESFEVDILFCSDEKIRILNEEWRGFRKITDVLSFPVCEFVSPGIFMEDSVFNQNKHLGDIVIAPNYVNKLITKEKADREKGVIYEDDEYDSGVSKAMDSLFTLEERLPLLMVHGILHLLGYDHEKDSDWKQMTDKENEVIAALKDKKLI